MARELCSPHEWRLARARVFTGSILSIKTFPFPFKSLHLFLTWNSHDAQKIVVGPSALLLRQNKSVPIKPV